MTTPTPAQAFAALRQGGLIQNDPDFVELFDISVPDYVERARAAKPALFRFDARTAKPEDVEARLEQLKGATDMPGLLDLAQPHVADAVASIALVVEAEMVDTVAERPAPSPSKACQLDIRYRVNR